LNDIDVPETEARIAAYQSENAALITKNKHKAAVESMSASEREEVEKRAKAERARMIEEAERVERAEDERVKAEIVDALSRQEGGEALAKELRERHAKAKAARQAALAAAVPPSLAQLAKDEGPAHSPNSPAYAGPYVPIPYNDPDTAPWAEWYSLSDEYADGRAGVVKAREDRNKIYRAGGWDVREYWELEVRCAIESLCIEPLE
jgi:CDK-activating kinase assembly factor MAT1